MTELEHKILIYTESHSDVHWVQLLNDMHPDASYKDTDTVARGFLSDNLLENTTPLEHPPHCRVKISGKGRLALLSENDRILKEESSRQEQIYKEQTAKDERNRLLEADAARNAKEKRSDRCFQLMLALLQAFLSFLTGILVEHFTGIAGLIVELFK